MGAPSGTVTFLFTDIEESTRRWEEMPEPMRDALARHDDVIRGAIEGHGGYVFATGGDGFAAAFGRAGDAVAAAAEAQAAMNAEAWPEDAAIRVRMGLHTGEAFEREGDYFGPAVNRTARLMALANGGQVLCSSVTAELTQLDVPLQDLGEHRLRDLTAPQHVFQVGVGRFPPLRSLDSFPGNLPLQVSSFIGRDTELARADKALHEARVVTLTGVGGVGKTRLALQAAAAALPRFPDGAWLVELQAVRDPDGVVNAVATALDVSPRGGKSVDAALVDFLRLKRLLLLLDNAEHLLEAVAELVDGLERSCPGLVVLVTSREGLALEGERVLPVPSLAAPPAGTALEAAAAADAVRLFAERAQAVDPEFGLSEANVASVVEVCRRLDGVPLAIELAAARVTAMTPTELARGLDRRFATLAGGRRRAVQRHQTLRAAIDWSYELLDDVERRLLARLAVFAGGCTREAAEQVCGAPPLSSGQVFEGLAGLVAKSLVVAQREGNETRYRLLETIREYGEDRLADLGETDALRAAHAEYFCELTRRLEDQAYGPEQVTVARRVAADYDNLLAAMQHAVDTGDADLALRLVSQQPTPVMQVGPRFVLPVGAALGLPDARNHPLYGYALSVAAVVASFQGDLDRAESLSEEAVAATPRLDAGRRVDFLCQVRGAVASARGDLAEAARQLTEGAELARHSQWVGSTFRTCQALAGAAIAHTMAGNASVGEPLAVEAVALGRECGAPAAVAHGLIALAGTLAESDPARARAALDEGLQLRATFDLSDTDALQCTLVAARITDWALVLRLGRDALHYFLWTGERSFTSGLMNALARALAPCDPESAAVLQGATRRLVVGAERPSAGRAIAVDATAAMGPATGPVPFFIEIRRQATAIIREALGDDRMRALRAQGEAMDPDDALQYALAVVERNITPPDRESRFPDARIQP